METDYLWCSTSFWGQPRHDYVAYLTNDGLKIGQLQSVFTLTVHSEVVPLCLITPFVRKPPSETDSLLEFIRLQKQSQTIIIPARSIIRGTILFPSYDARSDFILFDVIDTDMFL